MKFLTIPSSATNEQIELIESLMDKHSYKLYELFNELRNKAGFTFNKAVKDDECLENLTKQEASNVIEYLMDK